jgi:hypothetical protein
MDARARVTISKLVTAVRKGMFWSLALLGLLLAFSGCGGGGGTSGEASDGTVVLGLTDAQGDFVTYTVDVTSVTLARANGAVINALPLATTVDFAQYAEMTEFLTAATVPSGVYTSATVTLDYSSANTDIQVEDPAGDAVPVTAIQDEGGNAVTTLELSVRLEGTNALVIAPGVPVHLTLDFDLNATNSVSFPGGSPVLTVQPTLVAEVNPEAPKVHRVRGALSSVNEDDGTYRVVIRPFVHAISGGDERFGTLTVETTSTTVFEINGEPFAGAEGMAQLAGLPQWTGVVAVGSLLFNPVRFEADEIYGGSSVPGGDMDAVTGNVISRSGETLTVKGAVVARAEGSVVFNDEVTVTVDENTTVLRQLSSATNYSQEDISVGQRVTIFGSLSADDSHLDATAGHVRMLLTTLRGTVAGDAPFAVTLQAIDGRRVGLFDFSGTGATTDADPTNYEIDVGGLDVSALADGTPVTVRGFVKPFGTAVSEDFEAQTIVDLSGVAAGLAVGWFPASATAFSNLSSAGITLDLSNVGLFHHVSRAGVSIDLTGLGVEPTVVPQSSIGLLFIRQGSTWKLHTTFGNYVEDLQERLDGGGKIRFVTARGLFDQGTATMTVSSMTVTVN